MPRKAPQARGDRRQTATGMGVILWSLSTAASDWETPEKLSRLCTIPNQAVLENTDWDRGAIAFEARILQPLVWFGLSRSKDKA